MKRVTVFVVLLGWVVCENADPNDLWGGALVTHAPAPFAYSAGPDYCAEYAQYGISSFAEQINQMPITSSPLEPTLFYVLAAWVEDKYWCGTEFGIGTGFNGLWYFVEYGPCLVNSLENATDGWPGPGQGTAIVATDVRWDGNFVATYFFIGYGYDESVIPLDADPAQDFVGFGNCDVPAVTWDAICLGAMGVGVDGVYCGPSYPPDPEACCFEDGSCQMMLEYGCEMLGGVYWGGDCEASDPCPPPPPEGACCDVYTGECLFIPEEDCTLIGGDWLGDGVLCEPVNPCPIPVWACCLDGGECFLATMWECEELGGLWFSGEDCDPIPSPCPVPASDRSWGAIKALYK